MKKYFEIYREFFSSALAEATSFRAHFYLVILMDLLFYGSTLMSVEIIYQQVDMIGSWSRNQFLFFISFMLAIDHLHMAVVSENFWNFSFLIRTGKLDFELLRPANTLFTLFLRHIRIQTLVITPVPWTALIYFGMSINLSVFDWIVLLPLVILGLILLVCIEILISMLMFVTVESFGINFLRMQFQQLSRWPDFVYKPMARWFFSFIIPVLLIGSSPLKVLIDKNQWHQILILLLAIMILMLAIGYTWIRALKSYESASS